MPKSVYRTTRDLHLYAGLFISPFVLVFAFSVFVLVHPADAGRDQAQQKARTVQKVVIPAGIESLSGRAGVDAVRNILEWIGVHGEVGFVQHLTREHKLIIPVSVPGRVTTVELDVARQTAEVLEHETGIADALVLLHKAPGPHLVDIRMNWLPMRIWRSVADATVYLVLFISASGIYLWAVLRSERRAGIVLLVAGAVSFAGVIYALVG
jgi:hypothetical protein